MRRSKLPNDANRRKSKLMKPIQILSTGLSWARHVAVRAIPVVVALMIFGCASRGQSSPAGVPTPTAPPGRVGLAYGGPLPQFDLQVPDSRGEAASESAVKAGWSWARDLHDCMVENELDAIGVYVRMGLTPVGMAGGAAYGAIAGESKHKVGQALSDLTVAMTELQVQNAFRQKLLLLVQQKSARPVALMTNSFPHENAFRVPSLMDTYAPLPADVWPNSECAPGAFDGIDTLLMIRVINHGLSGLDGPNSRLSLNMAARVTLIRAQDRTQLSGFYAQYDSPSRKFVDWASKGAQPFRLEFEHALQTLADEIVARSGLQLPEPPPLRIVRNR